MTREKAVEEIKFFYARKKFHYAFVDAYRAGSRARMPVAFRYEWQRSEYLKKYGYNPITFFLAENIAQDCSHLPEGVFVPLWKDCAGAIRGLEIIQQYFDPEIRNRFQWAFAKTALERGLKPLY